MLPAFDRVYHALKRLAPFTFTFACSVPQARSGQAGTTQWNFSTGWHRYTFRGTPALVTFGGVYAGSSGFLALGQGTGWVSSAGKHIPDLNLLQVGMAAEMQGTVYSIKAEGPNGGYIAVGSYKPNRQPYSKTRAEVAISPNGHSWRTVSGKGAPFLGATMTWASRDGVHWQRVAGAAAFSGDMTWRMRWNGATGGPSDRSTSSSSRTDRPAKWRRWRWARHAFSGGTSGTHAVEAPGPGVAIMTRRFSLLLASGHAWL